MKNVHPTKGGKRDVRQKTHVLRPPRLEGKVKNLGIKPVRKPKKARVQTRRAHKPQGYGAAARKQYQLKGPKH